VSWRDYFGRQRRETIAEADRKLEEAQSRWARFLREAHENAKRYADSLEHEVTGEWRSKPDDPSAHR
jgi:hypothetical protein